MATLLDHPTKFEQPVELVEDKKDDLLPGEEVDLDLAQTGGAGVMKSRFDQLPLLKTVWVFRRVAFYIFLVYNMNMLDGWQIGIAGSIIVNKGFLQQFGSKDAGGVYALDPTWVSAWGAIINVGQMVSMLYVPYVANRYGRKIAFYLCWVAFICCLFCLTFAKSPAIWLLGKLFVGVAAGTAQLTTAPYAVEVAPNRIRGGLATFQGVWSGLIGIVFSAMMYITNLKYPYFYKLPIYVLWGLSGMMLAFIVFVPESPWTYARRGDREKAQKVMKRLYGNIEGYDYEEEWLIILRTLEHEKEVMREQGATKWKDLFIGMNGKRTVLLVGYWFAQIWGGLSMIGTYGTYFYAIAGLADPFKASLITSGVGLTNTFVYALLVDRVGRRPLICGAYTVASITLWLMGGLFYLGTKPAGIALLVLTNVWGCASGIYGGLYFLIAAELPSAHLRIKTNTFGLFTGASWAIITCFMSPPLLVHLQLRAAFIFAGTSVPCMIGLWLYLPETKGRAAAEIDELFERKIPAWRWNKTKTLIEERTEAAIVGDGK